MFKPLFPLFILLSSVLALADPTFEYLNAKCVMKVTKGVAERSLILTYSLNSSKLPCEVILKGVKVDSSSYFQNSYENCKLKFESSLARLERQGFRCRVKEKDAPAKGIEVEKNEGAL